MSQFKLTLLIAAVLASTTTAALAGPAFVGLGDLPGGDDFSRAFGLSGDGRVVIGRSRVAGGTEAFRWTVEGGMQGLGDLPGGFFFSSSFGVSFDGSVIAGQARSGFSGGVTSQGLEGFRWTAAGGIQGLGDFPGGIFSSEAQGVSSDGSVIVGLGHPGLGFEAFRWTAGGGMQGLGDLPGGDFFSVAFGVSGDGSVVVGRSSSAASSAEAFVWDVGSGMVGIGDLPGGAFASDARSTSFDGSVVVGESESAAGVEAFIWSLADGMIGLGDLPGGDFDSRARRVSSDGSVIVGQASSALGAEAFIWDVANGMRSVKSVLETEKGLDLTGWQLTSAWGISDDNSVIVGTGINPDGQTEAWMANLGTDSSPVPEPTSLTLLLTGALALLFTGVRRRRRGRGLLEVQV